MNQAREELIQTIKDFGQSLIEDAEKIAADFQYTNDLVITCYVGDRDQHPYINVSLDYCPTAWIERMRRKYL